MCAFKHPQTRPTVEWWVQLLGQPDADYGHRPTQEQLDAFAARLGAYIDDAIDRKAWPVRPAWDDYILIDVDYGLCSALADAAQETAVRWPNKALTRIERDLVEAKRGYGAQFEVLWRRAHADDSNRGPPMPEVTVYTALFDEFGSAHFLDDVPTGYPLTVMEGADRTHWCFYEAGRIMPKKAYPDEESAVRALAGLPPLTNNKEE